MIVARVIHAALTVPFLTMKRFDIVGVVGAFCPVSLLVVPTHPHPLEYREQRLQFQLHLWHAQLPCSPAASTTASCLHVRKALCS